MVPFFNCSSTAALDVYKRQNKTIKTRWDEKAREKRIKKKRAFTITELALEEGKDCLVLSGYLRNNMKKPVHFVMARLKFCDANHHLVKEDVWYLAYKNYLKQDEMVKCEYLLLDYDDIENFDIHAIKYKH